MVMIRGQYHFMFQSCEARKHNPTEAHIRLYAVRHVRNAAGKVVAFFQSQYMRLQHPNDDLGGYLILHMPALVVHRVDAWSPLIPPLTGTRPVGQGVSNSFRFPEVFTHAPAGVN